ncbi:hypothetical protein G6M87_09145 [Rhizobium rhizogenes]|uniref:hypothetical protein n=1 Tax=Rhizobium rhizogenes TaxID=359 RepID=UPI0015737772|nr:hypothetical protein [Rhizobium rhizogenes]NTI22027.1 hypothetical protein [Rhizobium rhizogenes]QTG05633.1 hypothetical protein G6M87_09145 [Rhizobium rhizogenes]
MSWALDQIEAMSPDEISRGPRLCISDADFDEVERLLNAGPQAKNLNGDRLLRHKGAIIYTHYANRKAGLA